MRPLPELSVSVVVLAYADGRWPLLAAALDSLRAQTRPPDEIVVVIDNNPGLLERARDAWPDVVVVPSAGARGESAARNTGVATARGAIVAFIDDDAVADPDWLERLLAGYAGPSVAAVGGLLVPMWESERPAWLGPEYDWVVGCSHSGMPRHAMPVRNLIGANMSFRKEALLAAGAFHESVGRVSALPFGCSETELCIRLHALRPDAVVLYDPAARVRHRVPVERARWGYFVRRCYAEGRSKAVVTRLAGGRAIASERHYLARTLPRAFAAGLRGWRRGGLLRAAAIVAGVALAAAGYVVGLVRPPASEKPIARLTTLRAMRSTAVSGSRSNR